MVSWTVNVAVYFQLSPPGRRSRWPCSTWSRFTFVFQSPPWSSSGACCFPVRRPLVLMILINDLMLFCTDVSQLVWGKILICICAFHSIRLLILFAFSWSFSQSLQCALEVPTHQGRGDAEVRMTRQQIFSINTKHDANVHLNVTQQMKLEVLSVAPEKNEGQICGGGVGRSCWWRTGGDK